MSLFGDESSDRGPRERKAAYRIRHDVLDVLQPELLRAPLEESVPADCAARWVLAVVMSLELEMFGPPTQGGAGYDPRRLLGLWLLAIHDRLGSSRQIERFTWDPQYLYVMAGHRPDHTTICRFRRSLADLLPRLLALSVERAREFGLVKLDLVALDGTRMAGNVSQWAKALRNVRLDDEGEETSPSDPDVRVQKTQRGYVVGYNAQAMVDTQSGIVVAGYVTNSPADQEQMEPALEACRKTSGAYPAKLAADGGYSTAANASRLDARGVIGFVPAHHASDWSQDEDGLLRCSCGSARHRSDHVQSKGKPFVRLVCRTCRRTLKLPVNVNPGSWLGMIERGKTQEAKYMQEVRRQNIEPLFSLTKCRYGLTRFTLRGLEGANIQWLLVLLVRNLTLVANTEATNSRFGSFLTALRCKGCPNPFGFLKWGT